MLAEQRLGVTLPGVPARRVPRPSTVIKLAPRDRMIGAHRAAVVRRFIQCGQHLYSSARIRSEVVPLVRSPPFGRQRRGRWMRTVFDCHPRGLNCRMALKVGSDKPAVPGPIVFGVSGRMNADKTSTFADVAFERRLLLTVERVSRGVQKNNCLITG